ncbi:MAG: FAD-binding oxidoreductase [Chloroflexota bacterium]
MESTPTITSVDELRKTLSGTIITPNDPDYEQARKAWDLTLNHYPAAIVVAKDAQDIMAAVRFAREAQLGIAVQSTGHGMLYPADDNLLIITSQMRGTFVDPQTRIARVEAGAIWLDILDKSTPHGLAPLLGSSPHVGVVGYTLGRGIGWLSRQYGFAADSLRWVDLVTADGELRRASPTENTELFWGLRGGGGNFGVVTALEFDLYPVPTVYGGDMTYPGELAGEALHFFREWTKTVPEELTSSIAVMKFPSFPFIPEAMRGTRVVIVRASYAGDAAKGAAFIQQWLDWHTPLTNTFHEMPFAEIGTIQKDPVQPTSGFGSNELLNELSDSAIDVILRHMTSDSSPITFTEIRHAGGAIKRINPDATAIAHRDAEFYFNIAGLAPTPEAYTAVKAYIPLYKADLRPYVQGGVYLNFMKGAEAQERIHDAFPPDIFERLLALKAEYDPENVFRYSYQLVDSH